MGIVAEVQPVVRRGFERDCPFEALAGAGFLLREATSGRKPRRPTRCVLFHDTQALVVAFDCEDDHVVATHDAHDAPLWEEDVVEIFLAPRDRAEYFEFEVNPLGATFDARIVSPDGVRQTMRADVSWECEGLEAWSRLHEGRWQVVLRIPFAGLGAETPDRGDDWAANLFRIDRHPDGDEFSAWQPTMRTPADFHVAAAFGTLRFV